MKTDYFNLIGSYFGKLPDKWKWLLDSDNTCIKLFYKDGRLYGVVTIHIDEIGVKIINSATIRNKPFTFGMRRYIMEEALATEKFIIPSMMRDSSIKRYADYDETHQCFYKGL